MGKSHEDRKFAGCDRGSQVFVGQVFFGLRHHSDGVFQFRSGRDGERLGGIGAVFSIGTIGDGFDNPLAGTVRGY